MAKRHHTGDQLIAQVRRCQELILARSGVDEFYETIRLLLANHLWSLSNRRLPLDYATAQETLQHNADTVQRFTEGGVTLSAPEDVATECLRILAPARVSNAPYDVLHTLFEQMTSRSYKSDKGQYFTPSYVVDFCMSVLRPQKGELICDPACGSGAFLKSAYDALGPGQIDRQIFGFDISRRAAKAAALLSYLACDDKVSIEQLDSLTLADELFDTGEQTLDRYMSAKAEKFGGFDVIATNPPFAGDVSEASFLKNYEVASLCGSRVERDSVFLERCIDLLKPGGRLAIVLPDNKFSGTKFASLRKWLATKVRIVAVVSLHSYTFRPFTSQKASVLFATKAPGDNNGSIVFYRSDRAGKTSSGELVYVDDKIDHDLEEIARDMLETAEWKNL